MSNRVGRNEPCPCGSGKKYKNCCVKAAVQELQSARAHDEAVPRAMAWLAQYHRKAFAAALQQEIEETVFACFDDDEEAANEALAGIGDELWGQMQINFSEWLLAEGDIQIKGVSQRVSELLLGPAGPLLEVSQRAWLEQLAQRPLRLYDITEVLPGNGLTLCDVLDTAQPPINVIERGGSRSLRVGMQIGARVMALNSAHVLSGAIYPFSLFGGRAVQEALRALATHPSAHAQDDVLMVGLKIIEGWLAQFLRPGPLPSFVHAASGEPLLFTTDHYEVLDWAALGAALTAQPDVKGSRETGWDRLIDSDDGLTRSQATVAQQPGGKRVSLLYKTATLAEVGRAVVRGTGRCIGEVPAARVVRPQGHAVDGRHFGGSPGPVRATARGSGSTGAGAGTGRGRPAQLRELGGRAHSGAGWPRRRARPSPTRLAWSASRGCCAATRTAKRATQRNSAAARSLTSFSGTSSACRDSHQWRSQGSRALARRCSTAGFGQGQAHAGLARDRVAFDREGRRTGCGAAGRTRRRQPLQQCGARLRAWRPTGRRGSAAALPLDGGSVALGGLAIGAWHRRACVDAGSAADRCAPRRAPSRCAPRRIGVGLAHRAGHLLDGLHELRQPRAAQEDLALAAVEHAGEQRLLERQQRRACPPRSCPGR